MDDNKLLDSSGEPIEHKHLGDGLARVVRRPGVDGWTLAVLALQALILFYQTLLFSRQTTLLDGQTKLAENQQRLNLRPAIAVEPLDPKEKYMSGNGPWQLRNDGPYPVRDLTYRVFHFKKFQNHGWDVSTTNQAPLLPRLQSGGTVQLDFVDWTSRMKQMDNSGLQQVPLGNLFVVAIGFGRDIDDKRYLYLAPLLLVSEDSNPRLLRPDISASSGPVLTSCDLDTFAIELTFEYFKRNPLTTPAEIYNYHYLLGEPDSTCLKTGPMSLRF